MHKSIMFQGTGSGVGKSILTAAFCRLLSNRGIRVAPFKGQNMALNSGVTAEGQEIGRAQILQAEAARIPADVRHNPILIKPQGGGKSQLIRNGKPAGVYSYREYYTLAQENFKVVQDAYHSLVDEYDFVVMEGAGSPAEINLQQTDITNMRLAAFAQAPVFLIGDIDRGGVFAWMKGTYDLIRPEYQSLLKGFIINKFRGDFSLLQPGIEMFEAMVPVPVLGTLPFMEFQLDEEDSQDLSSCIRSNADLHIAVVHLPHISNFTDFSPLKLIKTVSLEYVTQAKQLDKADVVILPGSKDTMADLKFLKDRGFFEKIQAMAGQRWIIGICGGYQMLGSLISDPLGVEGAYPSMQGLGLLDMDTTMDVEKKLDTRDYQGAGLLEGLQWKGYEIHMGRSTVRESATLQTLTNDKDLCVLQADKKILGTYIHGFFDTPEVTRAILNLSKPGLSVHFDVQAEKDRQLDELAKLLEDHCDIDRLIG